MDEGRWQVKKVLYEGETCWAAFKLGDSISIFQDFSEALEHADEESRRVSLILPPVSDWWTDEESLDVAIASEGVQITGVDFQGGIASITVPDTMVDTVAQVLLGMGARLDYYHYDSTTDHSE